MNYSDLFAALALVFIIESLGPFVSPRGTKRLYHMASQIPERQLRLIGIAGIIVGVVVLKIAR